MTNYNLFYEILRTILGVFIPIAWAIIFLPMARKAAFSWYRLVLISSLLSFLAIGSKEFLEGWGIDATEIIYYGVGILLGAAFLATFFIRKQALLNRVVAATAIGFPQTVNQQIPLRHLLQLAIYMEKEGENFYTELSKVLKNQNAGNICITLAKEESEHHNFLTEILNSWLPLPMSQETLQTMVQQAKSFGIFLERPPLDANEKELINFALGQEKKFINFYESLRKNFSDTWKEDYIQRLVNEENSHIERLLALFPEFKSSKI